MFRGEVSEEEDPCLEKNAADCWHSSNACLVRTRALRDWLVSECDRAMERDLNSSSVFVQKKKKREPQL